MMYLLLTVLFTGVVFTIIKEFERFRVDNFQAILANYFVAFTIGYLTSSKSVAVFDFPKQPWFIGALTIATIFIIVFNVMALTAQKGGLSVMSVASKMSVVIPIVFGIVVYKEVLGWYKVLGIVLALVGVLFTSKKDASQQLDKNFWYLPLIIFVGGGIADTLLKFVQDRTVPNEQLDVFSASIFLLAGCVGLFVLFVRLLMKNIKISGRSVVAGIILGIPNYYSIYFFLEALAQKEIPTSLVFTLNNLLIVLFSTLIGVFLYRERLSIHNYFGLSVSLLAIVVFYLGTL